MSLFLRDQEKKYGKERKYDLYLAKWQNHNYTIKSAIKKFDDPNLLSMQSFYFIGLPLHFHITIGLTPFSNSFHLVSKAYVGFVP